VNVSDVCIKNTHHLGHKRRYCKESIGTLLIYFLVYWFRRQIYAVAPPHLASLLVVPSLHIRQAWLVHLPRLFHLFVVLIIMMLCIKLLTRTQKQNHCTSSVDELPTALDRCFNISAGPDGIHNQIIA
jgi:hypothetical protein